MLVSLVGRLLPSLNALPSPVEAFDAPSSCLRTRFLLQEAAP